MSTVAATSKLKSPLTWTMLILCYLTVEWVYNQHLLVLLTYEKINPAHFEVTEVFGKGIASFGLNLVLDKLFRNRSILRFIFGFILGYIALSWIFHTVIDSCSNTFRHSSYYSVLYRSDVLKGNDSEKILAFTNGEPWYVKSIAMSQFYLTLNGNDWQQVERSVRAPVTKKLQQLEKDKNSYWLKYQEAESARLALDKGWEQYQYAMGKYNQYKNNSYYRVRAYNNFKQRVGLEPELTKDQFIQAKAKKYYNFLNTSIFEGSKDANIEPIFGRDIPKIMDKSSFFYYLQSKSQGIASEIAPQVEQIRKNKASSNAVSLIVIPPLSIALSLISIIANISVLFYMWIEYALIRTGIAAKIRYMSVVKITYAFILIGSIVAYYQHATNILSPSTYWIQLISIFQGQQPAVAILMSIPLKLEALLCFTVEPYWIIETLTRVIYQH